MGLGYCTPAARCFFSGASVRWAAAMREAVPVAKRSLSPRFLRSRTLLVFESTVVRVVVVVVIVIMAVVVVLLSVLTFAFLPFGGGIDVGVYQVLVLVLGMVFVFVMVLIWDFFFGMYVRRCRRVRLLHACLAGHRDEEGNEHTTHTTKHTYHTRVISWLAQTPHICMRRLGYCHWPLSSSWYDWSLLWYDSTRVRDYRSVILRDTTRFYLCAPSVVFKEAPRVCLVVARSIWSVLLFNHGMRATRGRICIKRVLVVLVCVLGIAHPPRSEQGGRREGQTPGTAPVATPC